MREAWPVIENKVPFTVAALDDADILRDRLLIPKGRTSSVRDQLQRAFTVFYEACDDARRHS